MADYLRRARDIAAKLVAGFEGCRLVAYADPATGGEPYTIGFGHTRGVRPGDVWTQAQADAALQAEVGDYLRGVLDASGVKLKDFEAAALTSFAYNVGLGNFRRSTLLKKLRAGDKQGAADQLLRWDRAAGKVMRGLTRRREAERAMFLGLTRPAK